MMRHRLLIAALLALPGASARAQAPRKRAIPARALGRRLGVLQPRSRTALHTDFKLDPAGPAASVTLGGSCATTFPDLRATPPAPWAATMRSNWSGPRARVLFEPQRGRERHVRDHAASYTPYFLQTLAGGGKERITDDCSATGRSRAATPKAVCQLTLGNTARQRQFLRSSTGLRRADHVPLCPRCHGNSTARQFVMLNAKGEAWRFEENEGQTPGPGIPARAPPILMVRPGKNRIFRARGQALNKNGWRHSATA